MTQQIQFLSSVEQIMDTDVHWILDDEPISYVRSLFDDGDGRPVAVVDHEHRLIGCLEEGFEILPTEPRLLPRLILVI